jgi:hypothetical protein
VSMCSAPMNDEPWVCIGHSHVTALQLAGDPRLDPINFWGTGDPWVQVGDQTHLRADLAERVGRGRLVLSLIGGSAHTVLGMVEHPRPFDFILPSEPGLPFDEGRDLVPADAVRAKLTEMAYEYLPKIEVIARAASAPVVHLEPPPPLADGSLIFPHVPWVFFPDQPKVVAPKWLRYKLWRMHSEIIAEACERFGVIYSRAPVGALDTEGFLHPRYDQDGAHANAAYGAMVLQELRGMA